MSKEERKKSRIFVASPLSLQYRAYPISFFCVLTRGFSRKNRLLSVKLQGDLSNKDKVSLSLRADDRYHKKRTNKKAGNT